MKRILCVGMALLLILTGCTTPPQTSGPLPDEEVTYGIYEFTFSVKQTAGVPTDEWNFSYTYNGEAISDGYQILFSVELFTFHSVQVDINQKGYQDNTYTATFPVAICNGGSGKVEVEVEDSGGKTATFQISCHVTQVGIRKSGMN